MALTLEDVKLQAEIEKLDAERDHHLAQVEQMARKQREDDASAMSARVFTFYGPIDGQSVAMCMGALAHWARRDQNEKIKLIFASPGGSILDGFALFDFLRELSDSGNQIETVALGFALSMGAVLLQAGDHRVMGRNSNLMIHEASDAIAGSSSDITESLATVERLEQRCFELLAARSTLKPGQIKNKFKSRNGWWLDSQEALAVGLCDEVR